VHAKEQVVNLTVASNIVNFTGQARPSVSVNGQIPGPTLHFKQGDKVTINVQNQLDRATAIHWHGIILPWQVDGVMDVTQKGILPGDTFRYEFTLHQSGTYWYHAHAGLQEQQGLYGAIIIDPLKPPEYEYTVDHAIVLSDWTNTNPDQVLANLKKDGDYYSPNFPIQPSLTKFITDYRKSSDTERKNLINDYKKMQKMRMSIYDLSDIAYDAYLLNGKPNSTPWTAKVKVGDVVRLRFIGAGGSSIFRVKIPGTTMQMVHIGGNDVVPYEVNDFTVAPGETFDVLVKIKEEKPYIIYAESKDQIGAAYGALITQKNQHVHYKKVKSFPEPIPVTQTMMDNMMQKMPQRPAGHEHHKMPMKHAMATESTLLGNKLITGSDVTKFKNMTFGTQYDNTKASVETNDPDKPVDSVIQMELFGYMDHYVWFINGVPAYNAKPILLEQGKRYRFVFTNTSMMNHPMHIHGHWLILRNGNGRYDPLLHTIDIPPGATVTADVDADASGQWFFHCHNLYHMDSGMARVFQYTSLLKISKGEMKPQNLIQETPYHNRPIVRVDELRPIDTTLVNNPKSHSKGYYLSNALDVGADPFHNLQTLTYKGMYGDDYNKLQLFINDAELEKGKISNADLDVFYWRLMSQFWSLKGGMNYHYRPAIKPYWQPGIGLEGVMPYFIDTDLRLYLYRGSLKLDLELVRNSQITNNFFIGTGVRGLLATKSVQIAQIGSGLNQMRYVIRPHYRITPGVTLYAEYEHQRNSGAFNRFQRALGESKVSNTVTFGISVLF